MTERTIPIRVSRGLSRAIPAGIHKIRLRRGLPIANPILTSPIPINAIAILIRIIPEGAGDRGGSTTGTSRGTTTRIALRR